MMIRKRRLIENAVTACGYALLMVVWVVFIASFAKKHELQPLLFGIGVTIFTLGPLVAFFETEPKTLKRYFVLGSFSVLSSVLVVASYLMR